MAEHRQQLHRTGNMKYFFHENGPSTSKVVTVATLHPIGGTLLLLSGMSFIGSLIGLAMAAPIFLIFSPVLVPAALLIAGSVAGFLTSGAFGITGLSSLSWIGNFVRGYMYQQLQNRSQGGGRIREDIGKTHEGGNKSVDSADTYMDSI